MHELIASITRSTASHVLKRVCVSMKEMSRKMPSAFGEQVLADVLQHSGSTRPLDEPLKVLQYIDGATQRES